MLLESLYSPFRSIEALNRCTRTSIQMNPTAQYIRREVSDVRPWTETCGLIRPIIEENDRAAGEVHHLEITDAKLHYHERTDEFYYILAGQGRMILDDSEIELH